MTLTDQQIELPFETGVIEPDKEFELWMEEYDKKREEVIQDEKPRHNFVNPDLFIHGNRITEFSSDKLIKYHR